MRDFKKFLRTLGIYALSGGAGLGIGFVLTDGVDAYHKDKSSGLELLVDGAHLKEGTHKVVISDQFCKLLSYDSTEEDQQFAINGIKKACETFNEYHKGINFDLCTVSNNLSKYKIEKIDEYDAKNDIELYLTDEILENNKYVLASTDFGISHFKREIKNVSITFRKDILFAAWKAFEEKEKMFDPSNSVVYTVALHEFEHAAGRAHCKNKDSIMYPYLSLDTPKTYTIKDIETIKLQDEVFYGIKSNVTETASTQPQTETL